MKLFLIILTAAFQFAEWKPSTALADTSFKPHVGLQRLAKESGGTLEIRWNEETNTPSLLTGKLSKPSKHSPQWIAYEFLNRTKKAYGLRNPGTDMQVVEIASHSGPVIRVRLQHLLYRTPVWGDELLVEINRQGVIQRVEGQVHPNLHKKTFNRPMHAAISGKKAIEIASSAVKEKGLALGKTEAAAARIYYLPSRPGNPLIYVVTLRDSEDQAMKIFVHALTGRVISSAS